MAAAVKAIREKRRKAALRAEAEHDAEVREVFARYDDNGSGDIGFEELGGALRELGVETSPEIIERVMAHYNKGGQGSELDFKSFAQLVADVKASQSGAEEDKVASVGMCQRVCKPDCTLPYQDLVHRVYQHPVVVWSVATVIIANFLVNIAEKEYDPRGTNTPQLWVALDLAFNVVFLLELLVNIYSCGGPLYGFWSSAWNCFDFCIVTVGVVLMTGADLGQFNRLKLLRAFRVFRLFKRIKSLNKIIVALLRAVPGVVNAFLLMLIFFCIYAILAVELFQDFGADGEWVTVDDEGNHTLSSITGRGYHHGWEYYGTFMRALYTLFQVMTGESWSEAIARPLLFASSLDATLVGIFFVSFILLTQIVMTNVVVAVLLDKFVEDNPNQPETAGAAAAPAAGDGAHLMSVLDGTAPEPAAAPAPIVAYDRQPAVRLPGATQLPSPTDAAALPPHHETTTSKSTRVAPAVAPRFGAGGDGALDAKLEQIMSSLTSLSHAVASCSADVSQCRMEVAELRGLRATAPASGGGSSLGAASLARAKGVPPLLAGSAAHAPMPAAAVLPADTLEAHRSSQSYSA